MGKVGSVISVGRENFPRWREEMESMQTGNRYRG